MCWGRCRPAQQAHTRAGGTWCRHSGSAGHAWCAHRAQGGQEGWWAASLRHCVREEQDWADGLDCTACMGSIPVCAGCRVAGRARAHCRGARAWCGHGMKGGLCIGSPQAWCRRQDWAGLVSVLGAMHVGL